MGPGSLWSSPTFSLDELRRVRVKGFFGRELPIWQEVAHPLCMKEEAGGVLTPPQPPGSCLWPQSRGRAPSSEGEARVSVGFPWVMWNPPRGQKQGPAWKDLRRRTACMLKRGPQEESGGVPSEPEATSCMPETPGGWGVRAGASGTHRISP